jgi:hypothetical protein
MLLGTPPDNVTVQYLLRQLPGIKLDSCNPYTKKIIFIQLIYRNIGIIVHIDPELSDYRSIRTTRPSGPTSIPNLSLRKVVVSLEGTNEEDRPGAVVGL